MNHLQISSLSKQIPISLVISLTAFSQIVETIYSPILPLIETHFNVSQNQVSLTISLYFIAFAFGIIFWGVLCDVLGCRKTILVALLCYLLSVILSLIVNRFEHLLIARLLMAFSASIGSIGTQTLCREFVKKEYLRTLFTLMGIALAISPALGLMLGSLISQFWGMYTSFISLANLGLVLIIWSFYKLPTTQVKKYSTKTLLSTFFKIISDIQIWKSTLLIATFNLMLFSYYQQAPFIFKERLLSPFLYGISGFLISIGSLIGAILNYCLCRYYHWHQSQLIKLALIIALISSLFLFLIEDSIIFYLPMLGIMLAYNIAIPNILATALTQYKEALGTAGSILGFLYYSLIGIGLIIADIINSLSLTILLSSLIAVITFLSFKKNT